MTTTPICKACSAPLDPNTTRGEKNGYTLLPCITCSSVTVNPWPSIEDLITFYQSYKGTTDYTKKKDRKVARAKRRLQRLMTQTAGRRFLDVGCNYGFTVKAALDLGLDARGIDIDDTAVKASGGMFGDHYETISVQDYAARGAKADIIYTSEVIEHVPDPQSFMRAIADILNPGGVLFLTTPDAGHFRVPKKFVTWNDVMPPEHITYFTKQGLRLLCQKNGLSTNFAFNFKPGIRLTAKKP